MWTDTKKQFIEIRNIIIKPDDEVIFNDDGSFDCEVHFCDTTSEGETQYNIYIEDFEEFCRGHQGFKGQGIKVQEVEIDV